MFLSFLKSMQTKSQDAQNPGLWVNGMRQPIQENEKRAQKIIDWNHNGVISKAENELTNFAKGQIAAEDADARGEHEAEMKAENGWRNSGGYRGSDEDGGRELNAINNEIDNGVLVGGEDFSQEPFNDTRRRAAQTAEDAFNNKMNPPDPREGMAPDSEDLHNPGKISSFTKKKLSEEHKLTQDEIARRDLFGNELLNHKTEKIKYTREPERKKSGRIATTATPLKKRVDPPESNKPKSLSDQKKKPMQENTNRSMFLTHLQGMQTKSQDAQNPGLWVNGNRMPVQEGTFNMLPPKGPERDKVLAAEQAAGGSRGTVGQLLPTEGQKTQNKPNSLFTSLGSTAIKGAGIVGNALANPLDTAIKSANSITDDLGNAMADTSNIQKQTQDEEAARLAATAKANPDLAGKIQQNKLDRNRNLRIYRNDGTKRQESDGKHTR